MKYRLLSHLYTECRYFVVNGQVYGPNGDVPILVESVAAKIESPFYSVDVVQNAQGELRLVELGDGQVSSLKSSSIDWFIDALQALTE
ncbi:MAG: ATP-grasp domain-containing protein [Cyanobacteria bacterium J06576_12]